MNKRKKTWVKSESAFRQLGPALQKPMDIVPRQEASPTPTPSGTTPALEITPVDDISCLRNNLKKYHLSGKVADNYHHCCCERQIDHYSPQISEALEFLTSLYDKNLSYWTLNTAHAALSSLFPKDWDDFGLLPLTVCFMIGLFENRAPQPRYRDILDVLTVLTYLATLTPLEKKSLKHLTLKLIMLLLLDTGQRCYEPHRFIIHISTYKSYQNKHT